MADSPASPDQPIVWWWRILLLLVLAAILIGGFCLANRLTNDQPVAYTNIEEHFKYGSLGGERESGIPLGIWKVLPKLFPEYLPGKRYLPGQEYASLGFLYEPGKTLPIGVSQRNTQGIDRVFLNCAACHAGTVRATASSPRTIYPGMPSNTVDLEGFQRFIFACAADPRFNSDRLMAEMQALGANYDLLNQAIMRYYAIPLMRERLLMLKDRFRFIAWEPDQGPGRTDTFNPAKTLVNYPLEKMETREIVGLCDLPSIWLQGPRRDREMQLHWDGNQRKMEERNLNASFGTGAFPPTIDRVALGRIETWLIDKAPPKYPFPIDETLRAQGEKIYAATCASCHGRDGRDFAGDAVGKVTPIARIGTDRHRLDSFTPELSDTLSQVYTGYPWRFSHFRKTFGYANAPLDGIWLRGPYLHNGAVPTLRDLLNPSVDRPPSFYRGYDVFDQKNVGFVSEVTRFTPDGRSRDEPQNEHRYFLFDTRPNLGGRTPRERNEGNSNAGHEGPTYGTSLTAAEKDSVVEYLKTF